MRSLPCPEPSPSPTQCSDRVARHLGALAAEDPAALGEVLHAQVLDVRAVADDQLGDRVEVALEVVGARQRTARRPSPRRPPRPRSASASASPTPSRLDHRRDDRLLDAHARRHVHEQRRRATRRCSAPRTCRGPPAGSPRCRSHELGVLGDRVLERGDDDAVRRRAAARGRAVDLQHAGPAVRVDDRRPRGRGVEVAVVRPAPGVEVELRQVGELPALVLLDGSRAATRTLPAPRSRSSSASRFGREARSPAASQSSPPSGARSGGSSRPRTPSAARA